MNDASLVRWHVLSKLMSSSVLGTETKKQLSQETPNHIVKVARCVNELDYFGKLLSKGRLGCLPSSDSFLVNVMKRSLFLQGDGYISNEELRLIYFPEIQDSKGFKKIISRLWKTSDPTFCDGDFTVRSISRPQAAFDDLESDDFRRTKSLLLPNSAVLRKCLAILTAWLPRVPMKKIRLNRMKKSISTLCDDLLEKAKTLENQGSQGSASRNENQFSLAFSILNENITPSFVSSICREAVAYIKMVDIMSKWDSSGSTTEEAPSTNILPTLTIHEVRHSTTTTTMLFDSLLPS